MQKLLARQFKFCESYKEDRAREALCLPYILNLKKFQICSSMPNFQCFYIDSQHIELIGCLFVEKVRILDREKVLCFWGNMVDLRKKYYTEKNSFVVTAKSRLLAVYLFRSNVNSKYSKKILIKAKEYLLSEHTNVCYG